MATSVKLPLKTCVRFQEGLLKINTKDPWNGWVNFCASTPSTQVLMLLICSSGWCLNYLIGNSDMHLKNYSLIETQQGMHLAPAYDKVSTVLIIPQDNEETALTINGEKSKLNDTDFFSLAESMGISHTVCLKTYKKFQRAESAMYHTIDIGRLPLCMKTALKALIKNRIFFAEDKQLHLFS